MRGPDYITKHFDGIVELTNNHSYMDPRNGRSYRAVAGKVTILEDTKLVGFKTRSTDSNWIARIEGRSGQSINVLGCKVMNITAWRRGTMPALDEACVYVVP